jgi:uncharacterized protein YyaL (SSP411 family)
MVMPTKSTATLTALLGLLAGMGWAVAQEPTAAAEPARKLPSYLGKHDPSVPAQETYGDWPGDEELERFYGLPWSRLAFNRAQLFGQPIFLVLTVDWSRGAQRLAGEVLSDPEVLRVLNQGYVSVVVNADLRPDIRERYQTGVWPAMAFLLPNGKPILSQANDMGQAKPIVSSDVNNESLIFLLKEGSLYWRKWPDLLLKVGEQWAENEGPPPPDPGEVDANASDQMARWLLGNADRERGGFGGGARFLVPLVDEYAAVRQTRSLPALRRQTRLTLESLVASPLIDRREGGMHRLAATSSYDGVQYEKLLTGNAQLLRELSGALREAPSAALEQTLSKTAAFLVETLGRPGGGFYLAQAADPRSEDGGGYWRGRGKGAAPPVNKLVLSGPNARAGAAMIRAGSLLGEQQIVDAGRAALDLVLERGYRAGRGVSHVIEPIEDPRVYLSTQAEVALAFLDAFESTGARAFLDAARDIVNVAGFNFRDAGKTTYRDQVSPSLPIGLLANERRPMRPNVRLARALLRLALHDENTEYRRQAIEILGSYTGNLGSYGVHGVEPALAVEEAINEPLRVRISGAPGDAATRSLRRAALDVPWGWVVVLSGATEGPAFAELELAQVSKRVGEAGELHDAVRAMVGGGR